MNKRASGASGEEAVRKYLCAQGLTLLARNYRRTTGEIDLIAREGQTVAFIEVKKRSSLRYGRPAEAVNFAKQRRIVRTAMIYAAENQLEDVPMRFDVAEVLPTGIEYIRNAFDASDFCDF